MQTYEQTEDVFGRVTLLDLLDTVTLFLLAPLLAHRRLLSSVLCVKHFIRSRPKPLAGKGGGGGREVTSRGRTSKKLAERPAAAFFFLGMPQPDGCNLTSGICVYSQVRLSITLVTLHRRQAQAAGAQLSVNLRAK